MTAALVVLAVLAVWLVVALVVGLLIGGVVRRRDRQIPES